MNWTDSEQANLLQSHASVWNTLFSFIKSMSLKSAIELGIPDVIHKHAKPMTLSELVAALPIHATKAPCVHRLMCILVHSGFFALQKLLVDENDDHQEEGYVLTSASQLLVKDNPLSVAPFFVAMLDPILTKPWHFMTTWFKNDDLTPFGTAQGMELWDYAGHEPKLNQSFNDGMASDSRLVSGVLIKEKGVFEGIKSLVDVGGGIGTVAKAIAEAFPHIDCTVLDLPHVVIDLEASHENLKFLGGDMFEAVPPADAILLKSILHDWNDEECVKILEQCRKAIKGRDGGKVIIIDMVMENRTSVDDTLRETQLCFDMLMMVLVTGRERNEKDWARLFFDAGFKDYKISNMLGLRSLIEVYP